MLPFKTNNYKHIKSRTTKLFIAITVLLISVMQIFAAETQKWYLVLDKPLASDKLKNNKYVQNEKRWSSITYSGI